MLNKRILTKCLWMQLFEISNDTTNKELYIYKKHQHPFYVKIKNFNFITNLKCYNSDLMLNGTNFHRVIFSYILFKILNFSETS